MDALIYDGARTPFGRYGGVLASVRADDLLGDLIAGLVDRSAFDPAAFEDVIVGCTNQAGEDCRNVARRAGLLAGLPVEVPGITVNRLCASGLAAVVDAARAAACGQGDLFIAGGVESHEPGAVRHGETRTRVLATGVGVRLHARDTLSEPARDGAVRRSSVVRDGGGGGDGPRDYARGERCIRRRLAGEVRTGESGVLLLRRDSAGYRAVRQAWRRDHGVRGRASAARHDPAVARRAQAARGRRRGHGGAAPRGSTTARRR